jgi:hypothetical protein
MKKLSNKEAKSISGGASAGWIVAGIVAGITFLVGVFDGFTRPFKCR